MENIYICTTSERVDAIKRIAGARLMTVEEPLIEGDGYLLVVKASADEWTKMKVEISAI